MICRSLKTACLLLSAAIMLICLATGSASARRVALVIGNADYQVSPLKNPVNDAVDMKEVLEKVGFEVILRTNADKGKMLKAIDAFAKKLKTAEAGLFFYAGHGMQINGANYLIPVHSHITSETDVEYAGVHAGRVLGKMEGAGTKVNIVILDACRDNPFKRSFRTTKKGLARMDAPVGSIIAYATAPGSMAADGESRNGLYTSHLLRLIPRQGLSINELFMAVRKGVLAETNSAQVPWEESSLTGKFFLAGGAAIVSGGQTGSSKAVLKIESVPDGADIFIDRRFRGKAPIELSGLEPGTYTASARLPGHKGETRQVSVHKGRTAMLTFYLDPEQSKARLYVTVNPSDARIRILSHALAFTNGMTLSQDRYQLEVSKPGYETRTRWVTIDSNQSIDLNITLKKAATAASPEPGQIWREPVTGMEFIWIPGGCFQMGSNSGNNSEKPVHTVCIDGFWMGKFEVTNRQFRIFRPYHSSGDKLGVNLNMDEQPAGEISWEDAKAFTTWLNRRTGLDFSLPTEAQWEYAARGGTTTLRFWGNEKSNACQYANVHDITSKNRFSHFTWESHDCSDGYAGSAQVGSFKPNAFGLYDMIGNVWEWCEDIYDEKAYTRHSRNNPLITSGSPFRVLRGGGWGSQPSGNRSASRGRVAADKRYSNYGFRLCLLNTERKR